MPLRGARKPLPAEPGAGAVAQAAAAFACIAEAVGAKAEGLDRAFLEARQACAAGAGDAWLDAESRQTLANLVTAVEAWQAVWPRLGAQGEFRAAVIREAGQWAQKLDALAKQAPHG